MCTNHSIPLLYISDPPRPPFDPEDCKYFNEKN